jgi:hypothetical protein
MLIVADGEDVRDLVPEDVELIHLAERPYSIGEKRNFAVSQTSTPLICHWDDDDWSAPDRLKSQVDALLDTGLQVAGFHTMKFTDGVKWWKYNGNKAFALGTSLCYRRSWWEKHPFPAKNVGEDNEFVSVAAAAKQLHSVDAGDLMHATIHPGNTSPRLIHPGSTSWKAL